MDIYPIATLEISKGATNLKTVDQICEYFTGKINAHPKAAYIGLFDHYTHTAGLPDGLIAPEIKDAKMVVFCFGPKILNPKVLALRPRSVGVCDMGDHFAFSFLEPPVEALSALMGAWVEGLKQA